MKARQNGRVVSLAATVGVGINADGRREVPRLDIGPSEAEIKALAHAGKSGRRAAETGDSH